MIFALFLLSLGFNFRFQLQCNPAPLPLVQIAAPLLRVQCPLLGFLQISEREHQHFVGQAVFFTDTETIWPSMMIMFSLTIMGA